MHVGMAIERVEAPALGSARLVRYDIGVGHPTLPHCGGRRVKEERVLEAARPPAIAARRATVILVLGISLCRRSGRAKSAHCVCGVSPAWFSLSHVAMPLRFPIGVCGSVVWCRCRLHA